MKSDRTTIMATTQRLLRQQTKKSPVVFTRCGSQVLTPQQKRQQDEGNFRDLADCVRHLTYHICPFANSTESWRWNLEQLRRRWHLFNGLKVIGVNHDKDTVQPGVLLKHCKLIGLDWDHVVVRPNSRELGEVMTWIPSIELLSPKTSARNEVVFSAHAKGVKYGQDMPPTIAHWTEIMYEANLDDWPLVQSSLEWFLATGILRARCSKIAACKNGWYYSGAFWWWRLADIGMRDWRNVGQWYAGREHWPGNQLEYHEADCMFLDNTKSPYRDTYMNAVIRRKWDRHKNRMLINAR